MGYKMDFKEVLLEGWEEWDTGRYDIPGKNVTLKDGSAGSILISAEGASVYSQPLEAVYEDEGNLFLENSELKDGTDNLDHYLSDADLAEVVEVFKKYQQYQASWYDDRQEK